ncbi:MAG: sugar transferase [Clostridia bacterium]|nr:sugar transferase [Clostridia bacterium]
MFIIAKFFKRLFDIFSSLFAVLLLTPLWLIVALAIKCDSKGPVFFKQERRTKNGKVFKMLKFRSMVVDAEKSGAGLFNYKDDPRVTKVGRFLRNSSIDELPQLFNILKGDMSVVGPRPCVVYELGDFDTLNKRYKKRFEMKAGLTGLAQVKGRNDISWDEKVNFDNEYIDNFKKHGIFTDIRILWLSVIKVFKKEDIYESKADETLDDAEAAKRAEEEIIRIAHLPDDGEADTVEYKEAGEKENEV